MSDATGTPDYNDTNDPERLKFTKELREFMEQRGTAILRVPRLGNKDIDLYLLYKEVTSQGGLEQVIKQKLWKPIVQNFNLPSTCTNPGYTLRVNYLKYLYAYERKYFLGIDDPVPVDYTPQQQLLPQLMKMRMGVEPHPTYRNFTDYRRMDVPAFSNRLYHKIQDAFSQRKLVFSLESSHEFERQWALEVLIVRSHEGSIMLRAGAGLLNAILALIEDYFQEPPKPQTQNGSNSGPPKNEITNSNNSDAHSADGQSAISTPDTTHYSSKERTYDSDDIFYRIMEPQNELARRVLVLLRNISLMYPNDQEMALNSACVNLLVPFLSHPDPKFVRDALETIAQMSKYLVLATDPPEDGTGLIDKYTARKLLDSMVPLLCGGEDLVQGALRLLANMTKRRSNRPHIEAAVMGPELVRRLVVLLLHDSADVQANALKTLHFLSKCGSKTRELIAREPSCLKILVSLLSRVAEDEAGLDFPQKAAKTLANLASETVNHDLFLPYEQYFAQIIASENSLSESAAEVLAHLAT